MRYAYLNRCRTTGLLALILAAAGLTACSGTMQGMLRGSGDRLSIAFTETGMGHGTLRTALPSGEQFEGKHVYQNSTSFGTGAGYATSPSSSAVGTSWEVVGTYSGNNEAVLFGDKGHTMRCRFQVVDAVTGMAAGGVGLCEVSDGSVIDVQF